MRRVCKDDDVQARIESVDKKFEKYEDAEE